ncbi:MAG: hypothetical protein ACR2QH_04050 [Geminicoccaceae bacterium]
MAHPSKRYVMEIFVSEADGLLTVFYHDLVSRANWIRDGHSYHPTLSKPFLTSGLEFQIGSHKHRGGIILDRRRSVYATQQAVDGNMLARLAKKDCMSPVAIPAHTRRGTVCGWYVSVTDDLPPSLAKAAARGADWLYVVNDGEVYAQSPQ